MSARRIESSKNPLHSQRVFPVTEMGLIGVEPTTLPLSGVRSSQLSYKPKTIGGRV